jgi:carbonic anhydrase
VQAAPNVSLGPVKVLTDNGGCSIVNFTDTGHYWEVQTGGCALTVSVAGKSYTLQQFHWHSPSEHTIGGGYFDAETHLVMSASDGSSEFR